MLHYLDLIAEHRPATHEQLARDVVLQSAVIRWLSIVGEAAANVSEATWAGHQEVPWREIIAMRHRLVHGYAGVNLSLIWAAIERDVPSLRAAIGSMLGDTQ